MHLVLHVDREPSSILCASDPACLPPSGTASLGGEREERGITYAHDCPTRLTASSGVILGAGINTGVGKDGGRWACLGSSREAGGNEASTEGNGDF